MSSISTDDSNIELAVLVRSFPSLWNSSDPNFVVDSRRGSSIWKSIGDHFSCDGKFSE